jgi:hypothetical protein
MTRKYFLHPLLKLRSEAPAAGDKPRLTASTKALSAQRGFHAHPVKVERRVTSFVQRRRHK